MSLTASTLSFGSQTVSTTSAPFTVTLTNSGTSDLTITGISAAGDFGEIDTCVSAGVLAKNSTCTISVTFTPAVTGTRNGAITITDTLGAHVIALQGTGNGPGLDLSASSLTFGSQTVATPSASQTVTLTNSGNSDLAVSNVAGSGDFAESDDCVSSSPLTAGHSCTMTVTFTPAAAGARSGNVVITDGLGTHVVALSGTGAAPGASLSPATLSFGSVTVGTTSQLTARVNLPGSSAGTLSVTGVIISGDYTLANACTAPVAAGGSCALNVTFNPAATGTRTGTAVVSYSVGGVTGQLVLALTGTGTAAGVTLTPSSIDFGSYTVGMTTAAQSVAVANTGSSTLTITSVAASGDFTQTNNCTSVAAGNGCTIQASFTPGTTGLRTGAITIVDNAGTHVVALSGTGNAPGVALSPSPVAFGSQVVNTTSSSVPVTLTNTGTGTVTVSSVTAGGDFAQTNTCGSITAGNTCTITVTFTPSAAGARNGNIVIVDNVGTHVVAASGTGTAPGANLSASTLTYGSQTAGTTSAAQTVTLQNSGTSALTVTMLTTSGDFSATSSNCGTLPATVNNGGNCSIQVTFTPSTTGTRTGTLIIGDSLGTHVVSLTGTGSAPGVALDQSTLNFGSVTVGTTSQQTANVTLDIATASSLNVTSVSAAGDYSVVNHCTSAVSPGGSCYVSVTFAPTATGTRTGNVILNYSSASTTGALVLSLTGVGTAPGVTLAPSSFTFGSVVVGNSSGSQAITLTNTGTSGLTGITITPVGDFSETDNCGTEAVGAFCTINVTFTPTATGTRTGSLWITDSAGTQILSLRGTGTAATVSLSPSNINFGSQVVGTSSSQSTVTVTNNGTATLSVYSVSASGDFSVSNNGCGSVAASGGTCTFKVTFTPTAINTRTGTVTISDSVGTHVVALTGVGNAPGAGLSLSTLDFGNITIGTASASKSVTLTNTGTSALTVSGFTAYGDYSVTSSDCASGSLPKSLGVNGTCTFQVTFGPKATGTRSGSLAISDSIGTHVVALTGAGLTPGVSLSTASLSFGSVTVGNTTQLTANVNVDGATTGPLTVGSPTISGDFTLANSCLSSISPGGACSMSVTFVPNTVGASTGTVVIPYTIGTSSGQLNLSLNGIGAAPGVTLTPTTLAYGSTLVGDTTAARTVTLKNSGTSDLLNISIGASGDFAQTNNCPPQGIVAGDSCTISVTFSPVATGTRNGAITVTDNAGTQVVALSGTGNAPGVGLSASNLDFGNLLVNTISGAQTVTVTNTGSSALSFTDIMAAGDFTQTNNCPESIDPNGTCTITVKFAPTQTGLRSGTVALRGNAGTQVIVLTGNGTNNVIVTLAPSRLSFGPQNIGTTSASQRATLTNTNAGTITVSSCTVSGDFVITGGSCPATLNDGESLDLMVAFQPTAQGSRVGVLQVVDTTGTRTVALNGTGLQADVDLSPSGISFGSQVTGTSSLPVAVTLRNSGSSPLSVSSIATSAEFSVTSPDCSSLSSVLAPNAYCTLNVVFSPTQAGSVLGSLTVLDNLGAQTVSLSGTGQLPGVLMNNATLAFGSQTVGTSSPTQTATLTNSGRSSITVNSITASGDYSVSSTHCNPLPFTLAVGDSCDLGVTFSPAVTGTRTGAVTVQDSAGAHLVTMTGTGNPPGVSLSSSNIDFGNVIVGASAQQTTNVNLDSLTNGTLQVQSITIRGDYTETDNCVGNTVSQGSSCYIAVTFHPNATGTSTGLALIDYQVGTGTGQLVLQLTAVGTAPAVTLTPPNLDFGSQVINTTSTPGQTVTLTNSGTSGLTVSKISAVGDFAQTNNCAAVGAGQSCSITVTFTPNAADTPTPSDKRTGSITITDDAGTQVIPLTGIGTAPGATLSPASLSFSGQTINTTSGSQAVTLTNNGTSTLTVSSVTPAGDFSQSNNCSTIAPAGTCTINVSFTPRAIGSRSGTVTIRTDAGTQVITASGSGTAPSVSFSPASIDFGSQTIHTTSAAQPVTVNVSGGSTLTITNFQATGDFGVTSADCTTVSSGSHCTLQVTFSPITTGTRSGTISVTDNASGISGSVQLISVTGRGSLPGVTLNPSTLNFGSVALGSSSQLLVNLLLDAASNAPMQVNSVTADGDFSVVNNCSSSVSAGGSCSMTMTFAPSTTGARTGSALITYTVGTSTDQLVVALSGTGLSPSITFSQPSISFGSQVVNTASAATVITLTNSGNSGLTGALGGAPTVSVTGDFTQSNDCSSAVSPTGSCHITINFVPSATGTRNGILTVTDNLGIQTLALSGTGTAPGVTLSPSTISFGTQIVGTTSGSQSITLTNSGTSPLTVSSINAAGDFAQTSTGCTTIAASGTCTIQVTFSPTATGVRNGTVTVVDNAGTHVATLSGTGNAPGVTLSSPTLAFGSQVVSTTSGSQSVTLTNSGTSPLTVSSVTAVGDFAQTNDCVSGRPLAANATCTITSTFTPTAVGGRTGSVTIVDGAGTHVISLSGTGTAPGVGLSPTTLGFGSQVVSTSSSTQSITLTNTGTSPLSISAVNASGDFTQTNNCLARSPLAANGTCAITVTFTPTATGGRSGAVTITDGTGSHFVTLGGTGNAPGVNLSSSIVAFGSQTVNTTSGAQTVTLTNNGTSNLTVTSFATGGDFAVSSSDCATLPTTLAPNAACTLQITFSPVALGLRNGAVTISDSLGSHVIALNGTGAAPGVSLSSANLDFGSVTVGANSQRTVTVNLDSGSASGLTVTSASITGDYSLVNSCSGTVNPGSSCSVSVTFAPKAAGSRTGTALIDYTVGTGSGELVLALTGNGTVPGVNLSSSTLSFGSQVVGTSSSSQSVTITNNGTSSLSVSSVTATGDFTQTNTCTTLAANGTCSVQVTFSPAATGTRNGTVTIVDNAGTQTIALSGTGSAPGVTLSPTTVNFGSRVVATTSSATSITLTNSGTSPLTITSINAAGDFAQTSSGCTTIAANSNCTISVTFTPTTTGTRNGTVTIVDTAGTHVATLTGTGTAPGVSLSPTSLTFANQVISTTSAGQTVTLRNTGTGPLIVSSVSASGDFAQTSGCVSASPLASNATCTINVTFTPTAAGGRTGFVVIADGVGTHTVPLTGTGTAPGASLSPTSINFGSQTVGTSSSTQSITLRNTGTSSLTVSTVAASGDFSQTNNCTTVLAGGTCTIQVLFSPAFAGSRTGAVTFATNAGTWSVALSGNGTAPGGLASQSALSFGSQIIGVTSVAQSFIFTNTGTADLNISSVSASGDFAQTNDCALLAAGDHCTVQVTFTPTLIGARSGSVTIIDSLGSHVVSLTGIGSDSTGGLSVSNLAFGSQTVGTTSPNQSVTLTNLGGPTLNVTSISATGDFEVRSPDCSVLPSSLAPNQSCTLQVTFSPTAAGGRSGAVTINDNNGTHVLLLSGTGTAPGVRLSPANLNFGSITVGTSSQLTANVSLDPSNGGAVNVTSVSVSGDFRIQSQCTQAVEPGSECGLSITFAPAAAGVRTGTAVVEYAVGTTTGQLVLALSGDGTAPGVELSPSNLNFGTQTVGASSAAQNVVVHNVGNSALTITSVTAAGDFAQTNTCATVAAGANCIIEATFAPTAAGTRNGTITLVDNVGTHVVALTGIGSAPGVDLSPATLAFGSQSVGTASPALNVVLTNSGTSPLLISSVTADGDFAQSNNCDALLAGANCVIQVTFAPLVSGLRSGTITVVDNAGTHVVALSGTGNAPGVGLSPTTLTFGSQILGTASAPQNVTISNTGSGALKILGVTAAGDFDQSNSCDTVAAGASCIVQVTFTPTSTGTRNGSITVADNAGTHVIALSGTGNGQGIGLSPATFAFGSQIVGTTSDAQNVVVRNTGTTPLSVVGVSVAGDFTQTNDCSMVAAGGSCTIQIVFGPATSGRRNGNIALTFQTGTTGAAQGLQARTLVAQADAADQSSVDTGTHIIALSGTGNTEGVTLSPATLVFGSQSVGTSSAAQNVTLNNAQSSALTVTSVAATGDFVQTNNCSNVASGGSCAIQVTLAPTSTGTRTGSITVVDSAGTHVVELSGTGSTTGVTLDPAMLTFGSQTVGTTSAAQSVYFRNTGSSALNVSSVVAVGDFAQANNCTSVSPGSNCTIQVTFTQVANGTRNGSIALVDDAGVHVVALSGTGNAPGVGLSPSSLVFGSQAIGTTSTAQTVTVSNTGSSVLSVSGVAVAGDYAQTNNCTSIAAGGNCSIQVTFSPVFAGTRNGVITLTDNAGIHTIALSGTGTGANLGLSAASLSFPETTVTKTSAVQPVTITNVGSSALTIASVVASAEFAAANDCTSALAPGATCKTNVTFTPSAHGLRHGTVTITSTAGTQIIQVAGTGADYALAGTSSSSLTAAVTAGGTATYQALVSALDYHGPVTLTCQGAPVGSTCSVSPSAVNLTGNNSASVTISVTTTAASTKVSAVPASRQSGAPAWLWFTGTAGILVLPGWRQARRCGKKAAVVLAILILLVSLTACGGGWCSTCSSSGSGGNTGSVTQAGTYKLSLVGTSADGVQHSLQLTLQVN